MQVVQDGLELMSLLLPPECPDYKCMPLFLTESGHFNFI